MGGSGAGWAHRSCGAEAGIGDAAPAHLRTHVEADGKIGRGSGGGAMGAKG